MKSKYFKIIFLLTLLLVLILPIVEARKGVGLKWSLNSLRVEEGKETCVEYGVYNPWEEDVNVKLGLSDNLKEITTKEFSESKFVPAGTSSKDSLPVTTCFLVDNVYTKNCLIGSFLCRKDCSEGQKVYDGEILALEDKETGIAGEGTAGSGTNLGISTVLKVKVACDPYERNWTPVTVIGILIVVIASAALLMKNKKKAAKISRKRRK